MENKTVDLPPSDKIEPKSLSRRSFLKVAARTLLGGAAISYGVINLADYFGISTEVEESLFTSGLSNEIPPSLRNVEIPKNNENRREPHEIVKFGLDIYNAWRKADSTLPELHWSKPPNYLDFSTFFGPPDNAAVQNQTYASPDDSLAQKLKAKISNVDRQYSNFIAFSRLSFNSPVDLLQYDPGSGIVNKINKDFRLIKNDSNFDIIRAIAGSQLSTEDVEIIKTNVLNSITNAVDFIKNMSKRKPVSTSYLFAYFLSKNRGNISQSFWDTTFVLKVLCRNKIDRGLAFAPDRDMADELSDLFIDEFSPRKSLQWLSKNVSRSDNDLNSENNTQYKDFQPINSAGVFYHVWNMISWSTCMTPDFVMTLTRAYYLESELGGQDKRTDQGREKIIADIDAARDSGNILDEIKRYYKG